MKQNTARLDTMNVIIMVLLLVFVFFFWNTPIVYPVKLFVVLLHELSHGLAALVTGGSIISIELDYRLGGLCTTQGGSRFVVASAGYLGSLIMGGLVLLITARTRFGFVLSFLLGLMVTLVTVFYIPIGSGWLFSIPFGVILFLMSFYASPDINKFVMMFIGLTSCLYAVLDIKQDLLTLQFRGSDADVLASLTGIPALFWGLLWAGLSVCGLIFFLYIAARSSGRATQAENDSEMTGPTIR